MLRIFGAPIALSLGAGFVGSLLALGGGGFIVSGAGDSGACADAVPPDSEMLAGDSLRHDVEYRITLRYLREFR